jgi:hypothetical protein
MLGRIKYYGVVWVITMAAIAPLVTSWQKNYGTFNSLPYSSSAPLFDANGKVNVRVDLYINTIGWVDITQYVRTDDGTQPISISRGEADEQLSMPPTSMSLKLNNVSGWASPRNPTGPYYGKIGRNTPIRVRVGTSQRFIGEIASLPQKWDSTGTDAWVVLEAAGAKRRLSQGAKPIRSPLSRTVEGYAPLHFWPLNDAANAVALYDKGSGQTNMTIGGLTQLAKVEGPPGDTLPVIETISDPPFDALTSVAASATISDSASSWGIEFGFKVNQSVDYTQLLPLIIRTNSFTIEPTFYNILSTGQGDRVTEIRTKAFVSLLDIAASGSSQFTADDAWHLFRITCVQDGTTLYMYTTLDNEYPLSASATLTMEPVTKIDVMYSMNTDVSSMAIGNIVMWNNLPKPPVGSWSSEPFTYYAFSGYSGETAPNRISRVCTENGLSCTNYGSPLSTAMGPQPAGTLLTVLADTASTNGGVLYDSRLDLGFCYRPRIDLYNQDGTAISYTSGVYSGELEPTDDDQLTCNDYTVNRPLGGSGRYIKTTGPLNINDPTQDVDGVGIYDAQGDKNLYFDTDLIDYAAWQVHLGTWDEVRIPEVTFELARECIKNDPVLLNALLALDITSVFRFTNAPIWIPPDDLKLMISGYSEEITNFGWPITFNTTPASRYDVAVYDTAPVLSRYSQCYSSLETAVNASDTTFSVQFTDGIRWVRTADVADALPFQCFLGGEIVTVTDVNGTTSPQSFIVTRSVNGVVKAHDAGTSIEVYPIARYAL